MRSFETGSGGERCNACCVGRNEMGEWELNRIKREGGMVSGENELSKKRRYL